MPRTGPHSRASDEELETQELRRRNAELEVLYETIRDFTSTLAVHEVIERLLDRILLHLDSEIGSVLLRDPSDQLRIVQSRGLPEEVVAETRIGPGEGISGWVVDNGRPLLIADVEQDARFQRRNHERYYTRSCISTPLLIEGTARGVLNVNNKSSREAFRPEDLRLLEAIAAHAAAALSNAQRFEDLLDRSQRDPLTRLANRGHFWSTLETEINRASRHLRPLALVMIDIDHFKAYNDRHGHLDGDRALVAVGSVIESGSRQHDLAARYGGEEFTVVLPETDLEGAATFAEKTRAAIEASDLGLAGGSGLTISLGVAAYPTDGEDAADLMEAADRQLYRAKESGRNRVCAGDGD